MSFVFGNHHRGRVLSVVTVSLAVLMTGWTVPAAAGEKPLKVVTTLPVLASLATAVGGTRVQASALAKAFQDPHFVQPRPTLMKAVRDADVFIESGLGLELWAEKVTAGSGNPNVQLGRPGRIIASRGVATLEVPTILSREWGDVHPQGNPHIWLDPLIAEKMAANIGAGLAAVDPAGRADYRAGVAAFVRRVDRSLFGRALIEAVGPSKLRRLAESGELFAYLRRHKLQGQLGGWMKRMLPLRGRELVSYHKAWIYFATRFGVTIPIELEDKPGITPSARHRDKVIATIKADKVAAIIMAAYYDRRTADYVSAHTGVPVLILPVQTYDGDVGGRYEDLIDGIIDRLVAALVPHPTDNRSAPTQDGTHATGAGGKTAAGSEAKKR